MPEAPSEEELAALHPELRSVLFGESGRPFSITLEFPVFEGEGFARALDLAQAAPEFQEVTFGGRRTFRARFFPGPDAIRMRDLYELVGGVPESRVLIDDRPLPYARELWLPLVWCLIQ